MDFHTLIAASDGTARLLSPKNSSGCPITLVSSSLMMPSSGSIIQDQVIAATTPEIRNGSRIVPRITRDEVSRCMITAVTSEMSMPKTTDSRTKYAVTHNECQNTSSDSSSRKLASPTQVGG